VKTALSDPERRDRASQFGRIDRGADWHIYAKILFWFTEQKCVYEFASQSRKAEHTRRCAVLGQQLDGLLGGTIVNQLFTEFFVYNSLRIAATRDANFEMFDTDIITATYNTEIALAAAMEPIMRAIPENPLSATPYDMRAFYYGTTSTETATPYPWITERGCLIHFLKRHLHPWAGTIDGVNISVYASDRRVVFYVLLKEWMADPARHHDHNGAQVCDAIFQVCAVPYTAYVPSSPALPSQLYPPIASHT
jgi:hypothetical protein